MVHLVILQPFGQITGDVTGAVVRCPALVCLQTMRRAEQTRHVPNDGMVTSGRHQSQFDRGCHVLGPHVPLSGMLRIPCRAAVQSFQAMM